MSGSSLMVFDVAKRRTLASTSFATLVTALRSELLPMFNNGAIPIPAQKARLTRIGGRCPFDATLLSFDPWRPNEHHCPNCQRMFMGVEHHDWWAMGAQLWVAERAAQAAVLYLLTDDNDCLALSLRILKELAIRYRSWPNIDNALGPTRPFFSTYLESIWLINLCHAISLLETGTIDSNARDILREVRELIVRPSRDLIARFHEGRSNRQVWNEVAILSASVILGEHEVVQKRLKARSGLLDHFANGLLGDGTWYEGENYHLFAHRGLWYGAQLLRVLNQPLNGENERRFRAGFITPFLGVLPDDTLPSRRDSQYGVSIRQWRFAEWCELGIAHSTVELQDKPDQRLAGILHRLYDDTLIHDQQRHRSSTADGERNEPAGALSRASLSWRTLLMANADLPAAADWTPTSICLPQQGLAVIRRDGGRMYVALEGGHTGGGHGHPDRLALTLQLDDTRWLEDSGTGSYVEKQLHWYRSTLAHFAPLVNGASQLAVPAELVAYEDRGGAGWICKRVIGLAKGVNVQRTIVVADGYLIDLLEWEADHDCQIDLPLIRKSSSDLMDTWSAADPKGAGGLEDGFDFLTETQVLLEVIRPYVLNPEPRGPMEVVAYDATTPIQIWRAQAPLPPGQGIGPLQWLRTQGRSGSITGIWSWNISSFNVSGGVGAHWFAEIKTKEGTTARHSRNECGWHIALTAAEATSSIELGGVQGDSLALPKIEHGNSDSAGTPGNSLNQKSNVIELTRLSQTDEQLRKLAGHPIKNAARFKLGEANYVGTEQTWAEADEPVATIQVGVTVHSLVIDVLARTGPIIIPNFHEDNALDNERRDVNADGVQIHVGRKVGDPWSAAWIVIPDRSSLPNARVTPVTASSSVIETHWALAEGAWVMRCLIPLGDLQLDTDGTIALEVIVNERSSDRVRRRGQLVLSGGGGYGYLRGDRTDSTNALTFRVPPIVLTLV
ncbi:MAG: heparinase II/III family protein [Gemmatimonadaceae bacterium]